MFRLARTTKHLKNVEKAFSTSAAASKDKSSLAGETSQSGTKGLRRTARPNAHIEEDGQWSEADPVPVTEKLWRDLDKAFSASVTAKRDVPDLFDAKKAMSSKLDHLSTTDAFHRGSPLHSDTYINAPFRAPLRLKPGQSLPNWRTDLTIDRVMNPLLGLTDLSQRDPILDLPPEFIHNSISGYRMAMDKKSGFSPSPDSVLADHDMNAPSFYNHLPKYKREEMYGAEDEEVEDLLGDLPERLGYTREYIEGLHQYVLEAKPVKNMTGNGKQMSFYYVMVVGDGNGMLGYGEGKDAEAIIAKDKAFRTAVRNMDWVERCEKRTVWGEREEKLGSTRVILRERPPGFGLRCNRTIHEIAQAAGIKDLSAKVWGNRNRMKMVKCTVSMLWAAQIPQGMPRPLVESSNRLLKIEGMRTAEDVAKIRGRKAIDVTRTWEMGKGRRERRIDTSGL